MAKIKNITAFYLSTKGNRVTVGNNRQVQTSENGDLVECFLHGHRVVKLDRKAGVLWLDSCGYETVTTRAAIADFLKALEIPGNVSFAKGRFSARVFGDEKETEAQTIVYFLEVKQGRIWGIRSPDAIAA